MKNHLNLMIILPNLEICLIGDVSKDKLNAAYEQLKPTGKSKVKKRTFNNDDKGFQELLKWSKHGLAESENIFYVMEATGIYHEGLATYLYEQGEVVNVENPGRVNAYCKSAGVRTKTDEKDAFVLVRFGKSFDLKPWSPPPVEYRKLQQYYRAIEMRNKERTAIINRIKSLSGTSSTPADLLEEEEALLKRVEESIEKMKESICIHLKKYPNVSLRISKLHTYLILYLQYVKAY